MLQVTGPSPFEVIQCLPTGDTSGHQGSIRIHMQGEFDADAGVVYCIGRIRYLGSRRKQPQIPLHGEMAAQTEDTSFVNFNIPVGGWYALDFKILQISADNKRTLSHGTFGPFGCGERFLIAGQSYVGNFNDQMTLVRDPELRASAFDPGLRMWRIANDPQPTWLAVDDPTFHWRQQAELIRRKEFVFGGGSIWPTALDYLIARRDFPVGTTSLSYAGHSISAWLPGSELFQHLVRATRFLSPYRAILWQVGETDAIQGMSAEKYSEHFNQIADALVATTGGKHVWLMARSTRHPAAGKNPAGEQAIRTAIEMLCTTRPKTFLGPDIDLVEDDCRHSNDYSQHFNLEGQKRAGILWGEAIDQFLSSYHRSTPTAGARA